MSNKTLHDGLSNTKTAEIFLETFGFADGGFDCPHELLGLLLDTKGTSEAQPGRLLGDGNGGIFCALEKVFQLISDRYHSLHGLVPCVQQGVEVRGRLLEDIEGVEDDPAFA